MQSNRIPELLVLLEDSKVDVAYITNPLSIRYLTGFTGSFGKLLLSVQDSSHSVTLLTDMRYSEQSRRQLEAWGLPSAIVVDQSQSAREAAIRASLAQSGTIGVEERHITLAEYQSLASKLSPGSEILPISSTVALRRSIKDDGELAALRRAGSIADSALSDIIELALQEVTEKEFATEFEYQMVKRGADAPSFETIVASGPNSAMPHARPGTRAIKRGDVLVVDYGATFDGYHSDCTRTFSIGAPTQEIERAYSLVLAAQQAGIDVVVAGRSIADVDTAARQVLRSAGVERYFTHGLGHGIGLEIHEAPSVGAQSSETLASGQAITIEPGLYYEGSFGIRIEDSFVVTEEGSQYLTAYPKDWILEK